MTIAEITLKNLPQAKLFMDNVMHHDYITTRKDFFKWQYIDSLKIAGSNSKSGALMIINNNQVIGISLAANCNINHHGRLIDGAWHQEWYSEKESLGAGFLLLKEQLSRHSFFGVSGQSLHAANLFHRMRKVCWNEVPRYFLVLNSKKTSELLAKSSYETLDYLEQQDINISNYTIKPEMVSRFGSEYDKCWESVKDKYIFTVNRNANYMQWRYIEHPCLNYDSYSFKTKYGNVYYVWRKEFVKDHDTVIVRICDIIGKPKSIIETFPSFYKFLMGINNVALADFMCSNAEINSALMFSGMREVITLPDFDLPRLFSPLANDIRKRINFGYSLRGEVGSNFFKNHLTYFTKGDTNQDRPNLL